MIGFIGGGKMAEALIKGIVTHGNKNIFVSERLETRRLFLEKAYDIKVTESNKKIADTGKIIILAVKPQDMIVLLDEIRDSITEDKIIISIAAGITLDFFQKNLHTKKIVRVMPNTPVLVQEGMIAMSFGEFFPDQDKVTIQELFTPIGKILILPEKDMNAISALSGSGPAFIALFLEALINAGIQMELTHEQATQAALQTLIGTAMLLKIGISPEQLRIMVTSPGGITAEGIRIFEENKLKDIVAKALHATQKKGAVVGGQ